jgi:hypothetical protein
MKSPCVPAALLYDDSAHVEARRTAPPVGERPVGLVGRQVAGREFFDAYLAHGDFDQLTAVVWNQASADSLIALCRQHRRTSGLITSARKIRTDQSAAAYRAKGCWK